ncbi:hypothetical protein ACHQM5_001324 [Ranunculus cassubicifolius]
MSSSSAFSLDHLSPSEQLCYVQCNLCETVLAVSVPCSILFKTVTVRCGHCNNLLTVNMRGFVIPQANQLLLSQSLFSPTHNLLEEMNPSPAPNMLLDHQMNPNIHHSMMMGQLRGGIDDLPRPPSVANRPPEKRQRVPSAYNRFIKDEIQRIKAGNPDITHREAFSAAAKNWAHFPHIHFGLMPDQTVRKSNVRQQEGEDVMMKDNGIFAAGNLGVSPY